MTEKQKPMKIIQGREIAALLNPRPAVLVTCCDENKKPNVLSIAWHTPLSHNPPLLGISIDHRRYSHNLIDYNGEFVVNVVSQAFRSVVDFCGSQSGQDVDKFQPAGLRLSPAYHVQPPLIEGALAHLECSVECKIQAGDHTFFVGRILYAQAQPNSFSESWDTTDGDVLLCLQRDQYASWRLSQPQENGQC